MVNRLTRAQKRNRRQQKKSRRNNRRQKTQRNNRHQKSKKNIKRKSKKKMGGASSLKLMKRYIVSGATGDYAHFINGNYVFDDSVKMHKKSLEKKNGTDEYVYLYSPKGFQKGGWVFSPSFELGEAYGVSSYDDDEKDSPHLVDKWYIRNKPDKSPVFQSEDEANIQKITIQREYV